MSQMLIPKTERVCCPIWATPILPRGSPCPSCDAPHIRQWRRSCPQVPPTGLPRPR
jgi:hypothetical protein